MLSSRYGSRQHVSRTDEKGAGGQDEAADASSEDDRDGRSFPSCPPAIGLIRSLVDAEGRHAADEAERTRLICDIMQVVCQQATPETARAAGLTFVGWLARRRSHEIPHAVGIDEARESERRIRAARPKAR